ncbi:MAG: hypothetical protein JNJ56_12570, partial [Ignavibacteria bacterium]|nr:hypothetical protein [Ignavibacteria bacterium]
MHNIYLLNGRVKFLHRLIVIINVSLGAVGRSLGLHGSIHFLKILLLQLYIEKEYYDQALLMIDSFRHFLTREKSMLDSMKTSVMEFLKITSDLVRIKSAVPDSDYDFKIEKIKQETESMSNNRFGIKLWLKEKVNQL